VSFDLLGFPFFCFIGFLFDFRKWATGYFTLQNSLFDVGLLDSAEQLGHYDVHDQMIEEDHVEYHYECHPPGHFVEDASLLVQRGQL